MSQQQHIDDTTQNDTNEDDIQFNVGDYNSFFSHLFVVIIYILVSVTIGSHILYYLREQYEEFINKYFPTEDTQSPYCMATTESKSNCKPFLLYSFQSIKKDETAYEPKFKFDYKLNEKWGLDEPVKTMFKKEQSSIIKWLWGWIHNKMIYTIIRQNKIIKSIIENVFKNNIGKTHDVYTFMDWVIMFGSLVMITFFIKFMLLATLIISICVGINVYNNEQTHSYILMFPVIGSIICWFKYLLNGNLLQCIISFFTGFVAGFWWFIKLGFTFIPFLIIFYKFVLFFFIPLVLSIKNAFPGYRSDKYKKIFKYINDFSKSIMIIIVLAMIYYAFKYLNRQIAVGMLLCMFFIFYINRHKNDTKNN
jgi:hypothetical protein